MNQLFQKFYLDYHDEFLQSIEKQSKLKKAQVIFETPLENITKQIDFSNQTHLQKSYLFEIMAVRNITQPLKNRYLNMNGTLQFILYPNIVAINLKPHPELDEDLFQLEGKKILVPKNTEICRQILLLKDFQLIREYNDLL